MSEMPILSLDKLMLASVLVAVNGALSIVFKLRMTQTILVSAIRALLQLCLIGWLLSWVFAQDNVVVILGMLGAMTLIAAYTASSRSSYRYRGLFTDSLFAIFFASWLIAAFSVTYVVEAKPWYHPQFLIPFVGLLLGNSLNGISLALESVTHSFVQERERIENLLALGATKWEACEESIRSAINAGMIPITNSMMIAGLVSLPGTMSGQILAGMDPLDAALYQILILFAVATNTFFGTFIILFLNFRKCFNSWQQFSLDHVRTRKAN